jgi:hypothetical protein
MHLDLIGSRSRSNAASLVAVLNCCRQSFDSSTTETRTGNENGSTLEYSNSTTYDHGSTVFRIQTTLLSSSPSTMLTVSPLTYRLLIIRLPHLLVAHSKPFLLPIRSRSIRFSLSRRRFRRLSFAASLRRSHRISNGLFLGQSFACRLLLSRCFTAYREAIVEGALAYLGFQQLGYLVGHLLQRCIV